MTAFSALSSSIPQVSPIAQVGAVAPFNGSTGSIGGPAGLQPSLSLQSTVAATSFADMLAASSRQPAPATDRSGTPQADADARRANQPAAAPAHTTQLAASEDAANDDGLSAAAAPLDAGDDDPGAAAASDGAGSSASTHRTRKSASAASTDASASATQAPTVAAPPRPADAVATAADDGQAAAGGRVANAHASHGVIGTGDAASASGGAAAGASTAALQAGVPVQAATVGAEPSLRAAADAAVMDSAATEATLQTATGSVTQAGAAGAVGNAAAAGAASAAAAVDPHGAAAPASTETQVTIATPTDAPDFREALGAQVSVLVKDGVQTAELHLNPTDMGPISVRIAMDGAQAKIDFGADSADTRRLIETGLPELASALRDAGFTLSGGGVSDNRQGRSGSDGSDGSQGGAQRVNLGSDAGTARRSLSAASLRQAAGATGVDLYA